MSSPYPVLNDRRIDQWKVTELKEELRRRKLKTNGLKEELVRRLDEALRAESEEAEKEELGNGVDPESDAADNTDLDDRVERVDDEERDDEERDAVPAESNAVDAAVVENVADTEERDGQDIDHTTSDAAAEGTTKDATLMGNNESGIQGGLGEVESDVQDAKFDGQDISDAAAEEATKNAVLVGNSEGDNQGVLGRLESDVQDARCDEEIKDAQPSAEDAEPIVSEPTNQVSEVSTGLGFQVKSESISNDSVSINVKNELKDNLNANDVHLEQEVVKPEMVQPSSSDVPIVGGNSDPLEDDEKLINSQASLEEAGDITFATDMDVCKTIEGLDVESPEKLNLDDDSMEEDVLESKHIESKNTSGEGDRKENMAEVAKPIDVVVGRLTPEKKAMLIDEDHKPTAAVTKRKAEDQRVVNPTTIEPKRQRRWNSDAVKAPEQQPSNATSNTRKDSFQAAPVRSFSRSNSSLSGDAPKERIVPPSQKPATTSLRIDHFLRPFTLKAVQELLAKTGTVTDFWMDQIKTHCYVTYSSIEEATATRNALYNLQWPTNGGRLLTADFVEPQEVKQRLEAPQQPPAPIAPSPTTPKGPPFQRQPLASPAAARPNNLRQQLPPPPPLPLPPALSNPPPARERLPPPPPVQKKPDPPIVTLDDLFKKTNATPRIYYLPLSEEQVAAKIQAEQRKS